MPACSRSSPQQLTRAEIDTIKEMVTCDQYRHVPTGILSVLAQRLGKVFASVGRVDNVYGDRNLVCSCPPMEVWAEAS